MASHTSNDTSVGVAPVTSTTTVAATPSATGGAGGGAGAGVVVSSTSTSTNSSTTSTTKTWPATCQIDAKPVAAGMALAAFQKAFKAAKHVGVLTGAGCSAESGIPTFRGAGGLWRQMNAMDLATPEAFEANPSLVWQFYSYRREVVRKSQPNAGHFALAAAQAKLAKEGRQLSIITQNIDGLHQAAGASNVLELHGSLWRVKRVGHSGFAERAGSVWEERDIVVDSDDVPLDKLPHAPDDGKLLRPAVVWFGEGLDPGVMGDVESILAKVDMLLVVGTSSVVYPAAGLAPQVAARGCPVAEFNLETTGTTGVCKFAFQGKSGELLPAALGVEQEVADAMPAAGAADGGT